MNEGKALLAAICDDPADDTSRLVYTDWLDENGDPERAEFIRGQIELLRLGPDDPRLDLSNNALKQRLGKRISL